MGEDEMTVKDWLSVVLDSVDYTNNNCRSNDMVGAVLEAGIIASARAALKEEPAQLSSNTDYTAALEWELTQFLTDRNIYDGEKETLELAKRLNSVVKKQQQNRA